MLRIGSLYGHGFDAGQRAGLQGVGFSLRPQASVYAGSQLCHFIDFSTGPAMELIEVTDRSDYELFVPAGMAAYSPGVSLVVEGGSPAALDAYERQFAAFEPYRLHVPYEAGAQPGAPGWHYLNFARPIVPGMFIWLTAFDQPKPEPERVPQHRNRVVGIVSLLLEVDPEQLDGLARLAGQPSTDAALRIGDVTVAVLPTDGPPRRFPLRAVVLRAADLDTVRALAGTVEQTQAMGQPALRIKTNPWAFDLLITA